MSTRAWLATDYYDVLGVARDASTEEITRAFRTTAKDHHPDRTDDTGARERFTAVSEAYGVLRNPEHRARYDELRATPAPAEGRIATDAEPRSHPPRAATVPSGPERPLSVRALPDRRHARWASVGGGVVLVVGLATAGLVAWLFASAPATTRDGSDPFGRNLTLALVAAKLVVVGIVFIVLGSRRRRHR